MSPRAAEPTGKTTLTSAQLSADGAAPPAAAPEAAPAPAAPAPAAASVAVDAPATASPSAKHDALGEGVTIAPLADFGTSKAYGFGVGARAGYLHSSRVYLGGTFVYNFGGTEGALSYTSYYLGPEVGYQVAAGPIAVRPYVGGGFGAIQTTYRGLGLIPGGGGAGVSSDYKGRSQSAYLWPGVTILVPVVKELALGADVRVLFAPGQDASTATLANNGVLHFTNAQSAPSSTALVAGLTASYRF
jgi:hypothetical protein